MINLVFFDKKKTANYGGLGNICFEKHYLETIYYNSSINFIQFWPIG